MTQPDPAAKHSEDVAGLPEELLRHSLLLFATEDDNVAGEADLPGAPASDPVVQPQPTEVMAEHAAASDLAGERAGPTYHQLVKRELADYLRNRSAMADRHRENQRRQEAVKQLQTLSPQALPLVTPEKRPLTIAVDAAPRWAETAAGQAETPRTGSGTPGRPAFRSVTRQKSLPAEPNPFRARAPRNPPDCLKLTTRPAKDLFGVTTVDNSSVPGPVRQLHLQFTPPVAEPRQDKPRIRPAVPAKVAPATKLMASREQSGLGALALGALTIEGPKKRSSLSIIIEPLAALHL